MTKKDLLKRKEMLGNYYVSDEELIDKYGVDPYWVERCSFIKIGDKVVMLGDKKPKIHNTIYYDDEREAPEVDFELFKKYNIFMSGQNYLSKNRGRSHLFIVRNAGSHGFFNLSDFMRFDSDYEEYPLDPEDRKHVITALEMLQADFIKRLERYYERYKDKIYADGYWANR